MRRIGKLPEQKPGQLSKTIDELIKQTHDKRCDKECHPECAHRNYAERKKVDESK